MSNPILINCCCCKHTCCLNNFTTFPSALAAARLPFKRINPMPKENQPPKRQCAHPCPESGALEGDNENESSAHPVQYGPPLVNGRGPLDCFLSRKRPAPSHENVIIDLTAEESRSPLKCLVPPAVASLCLLTKDKHQGNDQTVSSEKDDHTPESVEISGAEKGEVEEMEVNGSNQTETISQLDSTQDLESGMEEQNESGNVSSLGNKSMLSNSSVISSSESSPQRTEEPTPTSTPAVRKRCCGKINIIHSHSI